MDYLSDIATPNRSVEGSSMCADRDLLSTSVSTPDLQTYPVFEIGPFEGVEKRLIVQFDEPSLLLSPLKGSLRNISKDQWQVMLDCAACQILSETHLEMEGKACTAYLLSESSLFVFDSRVVLKTCGTTTPLLALPVLFRLVLGQMQTDFDSVSLASRSTADSPQAISIDLETPPRFSSALLSQYESFDQTLHNSQQAKETVAVGASWVSWMMFSHLTYCFPEKQRFPHRSSEEEESFLNQYFKKEEGKKEGEEEGKKEGGLEKEGVLNGEESVDGDNCKNNCNNNCKNNCKDISSFSLSTSNNKEFYCYLFRNSSLNAAEPLVISEIMMLGINEQCVDSFAGFGSGYNATSTEETVLPMLVKPVVAGERDLKKALDQFWFEPHGYSCNSLIEEKEGRVPAFLTAHISPEPASSYASVEATIPFDLNVTPNRCPTVAGSGVTGSGVAKLSDSRSLLCPFLSLTSFQPNVAHVVEVQLNASEVPMLGGAPLLFSEGASYQFQSREEKVGDWFTVRHSEYARVGRCEEVCDVVFEQGLDDESDGGFVEEDLVMA